MIDFPLISSTRKQDRDNSAPVIQPRLKPLPKIFLLRSAADPWVVAVAGALGRNSYLTPDLGGLAARHADWEMGERSPALGVPQHIPAAGGREHTLLQGSRASQTVSWLARAAASYPCCRSDCSASPYFSEDAEAGEVDVGGKVVRGGGAAGRGSRRTWLGCERSCQGRSREDELTGRSENRRSARV